MIFHAIDCAEWTESLSDGPNIISEGYQKRSSASCAITFCSGVPEAIFIMMS
ncbi:hypothetical protein D3C76_1790720 [compost metagenome]